MTTASAGQPTGEAPIEVRGEALVLRGDRTLYWPRLRWLVVADVHIGKVQSLRRDGVALPDAVMRDDLERLQRAIRESGASRLVVLGDLVHDAHGLTPSVVECVASWRNALDVEVALVPGNHDRRVDALPPDWRVRLLPAVVEERPFRFSHEVATGDGFNWHGHVHPAVTLRGPRDRLRLPCFVVGLRRGILPAFSALTGGAEDWSRGEEHPYAVVDGVVVPLPAR